MQELYRIIVTPYNYDHWDIFTEDKEVFDKLSQYYDTDEVIDALGQERWEQIADGFVLVKYPYVTLGECSLRQGD